MPAADLFATPGIEGKALHDSNVTQLVSQHSAVAHKQPGSVSALRKRNPLPVTALSPAERTAKLLAFRGNTSTFGPRVHSKPVHVASSAFKTI
jgi:hypothetical protein